jgi:tRNA (Thr-GGU) A37 N-methylase
MSSSSIPTLQQLHRLDRSLSGFHDQLANVLYGEEYNQCVADLQDGDLVWLVDYLDKVRHRVALFSLRSSQRRLSTISIPPVPASENVCAN